MPSERAGLTTPAGSAAAGTAPSFLAFDPQGRYLYALDEVDDGRVSSFAIDRATGALTPLGGAPSAGVGPAHLSVDATGRWLLVANSSRFTGGNGTLTLFDLPPGKPAKLLQTLPAGAFPRNISASPDNKTLYVTIFNGDQIMVVTH